MVSPAREVLTINALRQVLKNMRLEKGLSLYHAAKRAGMCHGTVSQIESGGQGISLKSLMKLAEAYGVSMSYFLREAERIAWQAAQKTWEQRTFAVIGAGAERAREELFVPPR